MDQNKKKILVLTTGGTIDGEFKGEFDTVKNSQVSYVKSYLEKIISAYIDLNFKEICYKDSREINNEDRQQILDSINKSEEEYILITHGTYTMPYTARFIKKHLKQDLAKVIVLTGSYVPIYGMTMSDAGFNLGFAIASMSSLERGIYVAMNGRIFEAEEVIKDLSKGIFASIKD